MTYPPLLLLLASLPLLAREPAAQPLPTNKPGQLGMSAEGLSKIDPAVEQLIKDQKLAGASILVLRRGHIVYQRQFGHRDIATDAMMTEGSIFRIYSMSKAITSAAALMLVEEGILTLDDPIARHIPAFKDVTVWNKNGAPLAPTRPPTVRDLLRHTAGLSYGWGGTAVDELYAKANPLDRNRTLDEMAPALARIPLLYQPGTQWVYGVNTDVLGRIIEAASGQTLDSFLQTRLFNPLGMVDTGFHVPAGKTKRFTTVYADVSGKLLPVESIEGSPFLQQPAFLSGGAGLVSTITDYARFLQMIANHGTFQDKRYLKEDSVTLMTTNQLPGTIPCIAFGEEQRHGTGFGLGFCVRIAEDERWDPDAPLGEFGWGGMASTHYWGSPKHELLVITMEQTLPYNWNLEKTLKPIIYNAIEH